MGRVIWLAFATSTESGVHGGSHGALDGLLRCATRHVRPRREAVATMAVYVNTLTVYANGQHIIIRPTHCQQVFLVARTDVSGERRSAFFGGNGRVGDQPDREA